MLLDHSPTRILIVRLSALGDVVQSLPILATLRSNFPHAYIGWLVEADAAPLLDGHPMLNAVHVSHRKRWVKLLTRPSQWKTLFKEIKAFFQEIYHKRYEAAIDLQGLLKSSLTLYATGIPVRLGFAGAREGAPWFYTHKIFLKTDFFDFNTPIINHFFKLTQAIGCVENVLSYPLLKTVETFDLGVNNNQPVIALCPATQWDSKHWPIVYWTQLIEMILNCTQHNIILLGSPGDTVLIQSIINNLPASHQSHANLKNLCGKTSIPALQSVLGQVDVVIGPDSAPLHLAGAIGSAKLIGLYGPTASKRTPPAYPNPSTILTTEGQLACQPCDASICRLGTLECMRLITPGRVFNSLNLKLGYSVETRSETLLDEAL